jgi:branched-chain amino acid transport system permease protein
MPNVALINTVMYASTLILLSIGFTFIHTIEKFPNLAHVSYASFGALFVFSLVRILGLNPYVAIPLASLMSGIVGVFIYLLIVRPMKEAGTSAIHITFAMFALSYIIETILLIYSFWIMLNYPFYTYGFLLRRYDTRIFDLPGITVVAPILCVTIVTIIHLFLTRNRYGIAIRAVSEDPKLASSLGVNIFRVHVLSWFVTGALAGLAGAALSLWQATSIERADALMANVLAASILGGLNNFYGAIIGGIVIALTQRLLPGFFIRIFGIWIAWYTPLIPIILIVTVQLLMPEGVAGFLTGNPGPLERARRLLSRASGTGD